MIENNSIMKSNADTTKLRLIDTERKDEEKTEKELLEENNMILKAILKKLKS